MDFPNIYAGDYKLLAIVPILLLLVSAFCVFVTPGVKMGVDFRGGTLVSVQTNQPVDEAALLTALEQAGYSGVTISQYSNPMGLNTVEVELAADDRLARVESKKTEFFDTVDEVSFREARVAANASADVVKEYQDARVSLDATADEVFVIAGVSTKAASFNNTNDLRKAVTAGYRKANDDYNSQLTAMITKYVVPQTVSVEAVSASLSSKFMEKAVGVVIISSILTVIVVFIIFRTFVPSLAVLIGAAADVLIALGAMAVFDIPMTLASFAALLMLVGFSLDTDVLLTMRVIKRTEGTARDRAFESFKTGTTMSLAAMVAFGSLLLLAILTHIPTYFEIAGVAMAGLVGDLFATWGINAVIILWYAEGREKRGGRAGPGKPGLGVLGS